MLVNLRGIRESGTVFAIPTYVFLVSMLALIAIGIGRTLLGDAPAGRAASRRSSVPGRDRSGLLLLMRAFADGCSAITGVEAVSNGVPGLQADPRRATRARRWPSWASSSGVMFLGTSWLAGVDGRRPERARDGHLADRPGGVRDRASPTTSCSSRRWASSILAANTSFADFPRLSSLLARDGFMPSRFAFRGERLAFSTGIIALAVLSIVVLAAFGGRVEALIPLYAIGVFTSITLSQAGMVVHWWRERGAGWRRSIAINGVRARSRPASWRSSSRSPSSRSARG